MPQPAKLHTTDGSRRAGVTTVGGTIIGILPEAATGDEIPLSLSPQFPLHPLNARIADIVRTADAISGFAAYGTLSRIALACAEGKPFFGVRTLNITGEPPSIRPARR